MEIFLQWDKKYNLNSKEKQVYFSYTIGKMYLFSLKLLNCIYFIYKKRHIMAFYFPS